MPLHIIRQDITKIKCGAIVNPSNCNLAPDGGVDLAIHNSAGDGISEYCKMLGGCEVGKALITPGFNLPCDFVIHTVPPSWCEDKQDEQIKLLESCYYECLQKGIEIGCESIAFPLIATGLQGFPPEVSLKAATKMIEAFLYENEMLVYLVVYDAQAFNATKGLFSNVQEFIDDVYVEKRVVDNNIVARRRRRTFGSLKSVSYLDEPNADMCASSSSSLDEMLSLMDDTFSVMLLKLIDAKGMTDTECYKKANVSKQTWYKIMNDKNYKPSKNTVLAFAISLKLSLKETRKLLSTVGFALSRSNKFDIIMEYFISNGIYDIYKINETLFEFDQVGLGV